MSSIFRVIRSGLTEFKSQLGNILQFPVQLDKQFLTYADFHPSLFEVVIESISEPRDESGPGANILVQTEG